MRCVVDPVSVKKSLMSQLFARKSIAEILSHSNEGEHKLNRALGPLGLISLGVGSVIGAGLFSLTGIAAAANSGPAVTIAMLVAAFGCLLAGLCYAEFAGSIPVAGSAYTYAYASLGEWIAWIIGWDLILEYAVAGAAVSISWSAYLVSLFHDFGIDLPVQLMAGPFESIELPDGRMIQGIVNLPAVLVMSGLSLLLVRGVRESATVNHVLVAIKVTIILVFIGVGWHYIDTSNFSPYIPTNTGKFGEFGFSGIMAGAGTIFFAFVGFDAVSTAAQETRKPHRDVPIGVLGSLLVCTILYVSFATVLTGMVNYKDLGVAAPVAVAIDLTPYPWLRVLIKIGILCGYTSVILVTMFGQSRVAYSMARDGLFPASFTKVHPKYRTPSTATFWFMWLCIPLCAFFPMSIVGDMTSIGTLFAFVIVCAAVLILRRTDPNQARPFRTPFVPFLPLLGIFVNVALMYALGWQNWVRLGVWLVIGQVIYFGYSRHHSRLAASKR